MIGWAVLAQAPPNDQGPEFGGSSPVGLVVVLVMAVALALLVRSMNKHLRKVPPTFDQPDPTPETPSVPKTDPKASPPAADGTASTSRTDDP